MLIFFRLLVGISIIFNNVSADTADLIIFTKDRPLQLQSLLESINYYVTGLKDIVVLCHTQNDRFHTAYKKLEGKFSNIKFVYQSRTNPRQDFWPLIKNIFNNMSSPYFMFSVDDSIVVDYMNISSCIEMMKRTNAYAFYPYMGKNITRCYMTNTQKLPPPLQDIGDGFCTWNLKAGQGPWGYAHSVMMVIYPREHMDYLFHAMEAPSPNRLEELWGGYAKKTSKMTGLCYEISRLINVPINLVQNDCPWNNCSRKYTIEQLLDLFEQGWRIDIKSLYQLKHNAPHIDINIPLTQQPLS